MIELKLGYMQAIRLYKELMSARISASVADLLASELAYSEMDQYKIATGHLLCMGCGMKAGHKIQLVNHTRLKHGENGQVLGLAEAVALVKSWYPPSLILESFSAPADLKLVPLESNGRPEGEDL